MKPAFLFNFGEGKRSKKKRVLDAFVSLFLTLLVATTSLFPQALVLAASGTPKIISYQGRLYDISGNLLGGTGTTYYFKFSIWDNPTVGSGTKLWPAGSPGVTTSTVRQGVFNVNLGDTANGYPDALDYNFNTNRDIYLQVEVSSAGVTYETLSPRQRIGSTSFAELAGAVSGTSTPSSFGTTTPVSNAQVTIEATSTNSIALAIRASLGQTANLLNIQNNAGTNLFAVSSSGGVTVSSLNCTLFSNGGKVTTDASGNLTCANDNSGGSGGTDVNWTFFNGSGIRVSTTTNQVLIGGLSTTSTQALEVQGGSYFSGNLGIGTTSPYAKLSVVGEAVASYFTATSTTAVSSFRQFLAYSSSYKS
jgi:hypothetical protein